MRSNSQLFLFFVVISLTMMSGGFAQQKKKGNPCDSASNQVEMNDCAAKEYKAADTALNKIYGQLMAKLEDDHKAKLKEAELAWIKFRDAHCEFQAFPNMGGTIYPLVYNGCLTRVTNDRIKELKLMIEEFK